MHINSEKLKILLRPTLQAISILVEHVTARPRTIIWLFCVTVSGTLVFLQVFQIIAAVIEIFNSGGYWIVTRTVSISLVICIFLIKIIDPVSQLKKQSLRDQASWVFYYYWGLNFSLIICLIIYGVDQSQFLLFLPLWLLLLACFNYSLEKYIKYPNLSFVRFAEGSIGISKGVDQFEFVKSARNVAKTIQGLKKFVNVLEISGEVGSGKSSFIRMIVESLDNQSHLYTYISLTETNEAKDFSKLFSERWLASIKERYPKVDVVSCLPIMQSIFREVGTGFVSEFVSILSNLDKGLMPTKSKTQDKFFSKENLFTEDSTAKLFGNVPLFREDMWVIVIEEIERAQLDEVYRVVETIERFRNEGRSGLPLKLVFIISLSHLDFRNNLRGQDPQNPLSRLLEGFFYEGKTIEYRLTPPPLTVQKKVKYIVSSINPILQNIGVRNLLPEELQPGRSHYPYTNKVSEEEAIQHIVTIISGSSLRLTNRLANSINFFYNAYLVKGLVEANRLPVSNVLAIEYIKIKYPFLIDFFLKVLDSYLEESVHSYILMNGLKDSKRQLADWIESLTGHKIQKKEEEVEIADLIGLAARFCKDLLSGNGVNSSTYLGTTSSPWEMRDYLSFTPEQTENDHTRNNKIYLTHREKLGSYLKILSSKELLSYAYFIFRLEKAEIEIHADLLKYLTLRVTESRLLQVMNAGHSILDEMVYQSVFQMVIIREKLTRRSNSIDLRKYMGICMDSVRSILESESTPSNLKYILITTLINTERNSNSSMNSRLRFTFKSLNDLFSEEITRLVSFTFKEFYTRYMYKKEVLYDREENFFFTLYQSWDGRADRSENIGELREIALRGLDKHVKALRMYWDRYPYETHWEGYNQDLESQLIMDGRAGDSVYMPLENLIKISEIASIEDKEFNQKVNFWKRIKDNQRLVEHLKIKDDPTTLAAVLKRHGFNVSNT